jgi:hypothetical protein
MAGREQVILPAGRMLLLSPPLLYRFHRRFIFGIYLFAFGHVPNIIPESCSDFLQFLLLIIIIIIIIRGHFHCNLFDWAALLNIIRKSKINPLKF